MCLKICSFIVQCVDFCIVRDLNFNVNIIGESTRYIAQCIGLQLLDDIYLLVDLFLRGDSMR